MHKVVSWVFKFMGISIILMLLLDMSLMLFDIITTTNRIQSQASFMQMELAKNNYISEEANEIFEGTDDTDGFAYISSKSRVFDNIAYNYQDLDKNEIGQYGDFKTLKITADFNPWGYVVNPRVYAEADNGLKVVHHSNIEFTYTVPCLRYLK